MTNFLLVRHKYKKLALLLQGVFFKKLLRCKGGLVDEVEAEEDLGVVDGAHVGEADVEGGAEDGAELGLAFEIGGLAWAPEAVVVLEAEGPVGDEVPLEAADDGGAFVGEGGEGEGVDRVGHIELVVFSVIFFPLVRAAVEPVEIEGEGFAEGPAPAEGEEVDGVLLKVVAEAVFEVAIGGVDGEEAFEFGERDGKGILVEEVEAVEVPSAGGFEVWEVKGVEEASFELLDLEYAIG